MKTTYSYTCLRYVHDVATREFVNVGVVLYAPEMRYLRAMCRDTYGRIKHMFPNLDGKAYRSMVSFVASQVNAVGAEVDKDMILCSGVKSVMHWAHSILPPDDSSLQWSPPSGGITDDPEATLQSVFNRMVLSYDESKEEERRDDEEIWRLYKKPLEDKAALPFLKPRTVVSPIDQFEFKRTWQNGLTNCIEAVSFDYSSASSLNIKARNWLGLTHSLESVLDDFQIFMILGEPQRDELRAPFDKACRILDMMPVRHQLILESKAESFLANMADQITSHAVHG